MTMRSERPRTRDDRRYFRYACEYAIGFADKETVQRVELLLEDVNAKPEDRIVVKPARQAAWRLNKRARE